jgi:septum formation protein
MNPATDKNQKHPLILASGSPQRKLLLASLGLNITQFSPEYNELPNPDLNPEHLVQQLAKEKFNQFSSWYSQSGEPINPQITWEDSWKLTADTLVFYGAQHLGKPTSEQEARIFLKTLAGSIHQVITGVYLVSPKDQVFHFSVVTQVEFQRLNEQQIEWYLKTNEWQNAAGGYKIQGAGGALVHEIHGSFSNVIGLPLAEIYGILSRHNFWM